MKCGTASAALAVLFMSYLRFPPLTGFIYRAPRSTVPAGLPGRGQEFSSGRFRANSPHTHHHGRYTLVGARACSDTSPFVAPCPRKRIPRYLRPDFKGSGGKEFVGLKRLADLAEPLSATCGPAASSLV